MSDNSMSHKPSYYLYFLIPLFLALNVPLVSSGIQEFAIVFDGLVAVNLLLIIAAIITYKWARFSSADLRFSNIIPILIQGCVQVSVFYYVMFMNPDPVLRNAVANRMAFIFYQVLFAFAFEYLFMVCRRRPYEPGFYLIPMVFSINLFSWYMGGFALMHLPAIILGILCKTYIVRPNSEGRMVHIFNPSFIVLTISAIMLFTFYPQVNEYIYDEEVFFLYETTPGFEIYLLLAGFITLWKPNSYLISIGAYSTIMFLNALTLYFTGYVLFLGLATGSVMVAIMLAITDPATSPKTPSGKLFFGIAYGLSITAVGVGFALLNALFVGVYAKILALPLLNYFSNRFDKGIQFKFLDRLGNGYLSRFIYMATFIAIFAITYKQLKSSFVFPYYLQILAAQVWELLGIN